MASQSFVILTDPANCKLVDTKLLLRAVIETQQLSREGQPVSQAFCDNPDAAHQFIDAYANAYPKLVPHSPDLPSPDQVYSMLLSGRLAPLPGLNAAPDGTTPGEPAAGQTLLVLSLGKPEALMQALQSHQLVRNDVKVVEIPSEPEVQSAPVSVAKAIAGHRTGDTALSAEITAFHSQHGPTDKPTDKPSVPEEGNNASLGLESVESNLDHLDGNATQEQAHRSTLVTTVGATPVASADVADSASLAHADTPTAAGGGGDRSLILQPDPPASSAPSAAGPIATVGPESASPSAAEPIAMAGPGTALTAPAQLAAVPNADASASDGALPDGIQAANPSEQVRDANRNAAEHNASGSGELSSDRSPDAAQARDASTEAPDHSNRDAAEPHSAKATESASGDAPSDSVRPPDLAAESATVSNGSAVDPNASCTKHDDIAHKTLSLNHLSEDVVYPTTSAITSEDNITYPLPAASAPHKHDFATILYSSMAGEIVDINVIATIGATDAHAATATFDPILNKPLTEHGLGQDEVHTAQSHEVDVGHLDTQCLDHDAHNDKPTTPTHDLDI